MNYTICLDLLSINYDPANLSGNGFSIYSDSDGFTTPITTGIPASALFPPPTGTCPFMLAGVPNDATQLLIVDQCNNATDIASIFSPTNIAAGQITIDCCYSLVELDQSCRDFCDECEIGFDTYDTSTIGQIIAGNLTSSCGSVTDYVIGWYKDGDYSAPALTTGFGSLAGSYQFGPHPLTGNNSVPVLAGDYEGIIHDVIINGTQYTNLASGSGIGEPIPFQSCFGTTAAEPLTCDNGAYNAKYSHQFDFNSQAVGASPAPVSLTYALDSTTKYFAYAFNAFNVWDELEIKWKSGNPNATSNPSLYSQPIYLEKIKVGSDVSTLGFPTVGNSTIDNIWPKQHNGPFYPKRVLTLTNLETSSNPAAPDFLEITITPNPNNNNTAWKAGFQCLTDFDCADCTFDNYPESLPKISEIELNKTYPCDAQQIILTVSGCFSNSDWMGYPYDPFNSLSGSLITSINPTFYPSTTPPNTIDLHYPGFYSNGNFIQLKPTINCFLGGGYNATCASPSTGTITLNKTLGQIQLIFNLESDYLHYKNTLVNQFTNIFGNPSSPLPCPAGSTSVNYYKYFQLLVPIQPTAAANCGDNTITNIYRFHINDYFNIIYNDSPSTSTWSITIPQTSIVNCYPVQNCDSCFSVINNFINEYNSDIANPTNFSFTTTVGAKYLIPISTRFINRSLPPTTSGSVCVGPYYFDQFYAEYSVATMPFIPSPTSPTGWVNLPSLGASIPCDTTPYIRDYNYPGMQLYHGATIGSWQVRFPSLTGSFNYSLSTNDFEIYAFTGFGVTGSNNITPNVYPAPCPDTSGSKVYSYIGGVATVYSSSYFVGGVPTLIIDP